MNRTEARAALAELRGEFHGWVVGLPADQKTALYIRHEIDRYQRRRAAWLRVSVVLALFALVEVVAAAIAVSGAAAFVGGVWAAASLVAHGLAIHARRKIARLEVGREELRRVWSSEGIEPGKTCVLDADGTIGRLPDKGAP